MHLSRKCLEFVGLQNGDETSSPFHHPGAWVSCFFGEGSVQNQNSWYPSQSYPLAILHILAAGDLQTPPRVALDMREHAERWISGTSAKILQLEARVKFGQAFKSFSSTMEQALNFSFGASQGNRARVFFWAQRPGGDLFKDDPTYYLK